MSSESEEKQLPDEITDLNGETQKTSGISYTRDFLLSFSDLDACKKLPSGFDQSLLSEFQDTSQERQIRPSGGMISFRRAEFGSSPPTRNDSTSYSRGVHGRWEGRSSVRNDKDSESQADLDSDSSRRYGNQPKRWQVPEHDGLLGSGSFPRPSGYAAGASAVKARPNEHYQLNRSNEPYQPPRPYKAVPHSRRDTDAFNNETFGSSDTSNEDRAEEERKRRVSFELMRKEQHKPFQDKQKLNLDKNKDDFDMSTLVEAKDEKRSVKRGSDSEELVIPSVKENDPEKSSASSQVPASRPLVPPGFTSTPVDRSFGPKSLTHSHAAEVGNAESEENFLQGKRNSVVHTTDDQDDKQLARDLGFRKPQSESLSARASIDNQTRKGLDLSSKTAVTGSILYDKTNTSKAFEASKSSDGMEHNVEQVIGPSAFGDPNQDRSTSILDKLFSSSVALNDTGSSAVVEHHDIKADETQTFQSSKFACWFNEEEKKPGNDQLSGRPNDLLSLIVGDKGGSRVSGIKSEKSLPDLPFQNFDVVSHTVGSFDMLRKENKPEPVSAVLTCEDLEQSMLSEITVEGSISQPSVHNWTNPNRKTEQPKANTDNLASQHLLSLLQMAPSSESSSTIDISFPDNVRVHGFEESTIGIVQNSRDAKVRDNTEVPNSLTLETLFGSAFMKELQSVGAPVSSHRGTAGTTIHDVSDPHGFPFPVSNNHETGFSSTLHDGSGVIPVNKRKQSRVDKVEEPWLKFDEPQVDLNSSQLRANFGTKVVGFNSPGDVRLPEEDSLISANNPSTIENFIKPELLPSSNTSIDFAEKLSAFNTTFRDERSIRGGGQELPFHRGPYDMRESGHSYQNQNTQPSFAQLHHPQLNNMGQSFPHMDSRPVNINSQMKFMAPEGAAHHESLPNHQMQMNMLRPPFHHPSSGLSGFDQPIPHPMLQQIHMQGNFPPNMLQGQSRGGPPSMPSHPNRGSLMHAHPNFGNLGMPPQAQDIGGGSTHPEALQRLLEMELRSNPKQIHQFGGGGGQNHGKYGHELDMGFGFR